MAINFYIFFTICLFFTKFAMAIDGPSSTNHQNPRTINGIAHPRNIEGQLAAAAAAADHIPHSNQPTNNATNQNHPNDHNANSENSNLAPNSATEQHSRNNAGRPTENLIIENENRTHFNDQSKSIVTPSPSGYSNANPTKLDETNNQQQLVSEGGNDDDDERKMNDMEEVDSNNDPVVTECCPICLQQFTQASNKKILSKCGHQFGVNCIDQWLHSKKSCPVCRCEVDGDDLPKGHAHTEAPRVITINTMNPRFNDFSGTF